MIEEKNGFECKIRSYGKPWFGFKIPRMIKRIIDKMYNEKT